MSRNKQREVFVSFTTLQAEARDFGGGVKLLKSTYTRVELEGRVIESAIVDGYQNTPASEYHNGVDVAVLRYHSKALKIKDGVYKLRVIASAQIKEPGTYVAVSELHTKKKALAYSGHHKFEVSSVELPPVRGPRAVATRINNFREDLDHHTFDDHLEFTINYCCKNGTCGNCIGPDCPV